MIPFKSYMEQILIGFKLTKSDSDTNTETNENDEA